MLSESSYGTFSTQSGETGLSGFPLKAVEVDVYVNPGAARALIILIWHIACFKLTSEHILGYYDLLV